MGKMKNRSFLILFALIAFQSCKDSSDTITSADESFIYPLKTGNSWIYKYTIAYTNIEPDSIRYLFHDTSSQAMVIVTKDTLLDTLHLYEMKEERQDVGDSYAYYANEEDGLIKYGYRNSYGAGLPKSNNEIRFRYKGNYYNSVEELILKPEEKMYLPKNTLDSIIYLAPPRTIYKYPLEIGQEWSYSPYPYPLLLIDKEVTGTAAVATSAGVYECYRIRWKFDYDFNGIPDEDYIYYEYVCSKGMIKKEEIVKNITVTSQQNPDSLGHVDINYEIVLEGISF